MTNLIARLQAAQLRGNAKPEDVGAGGLLDQAIACLREVADEVAEYAWPETYTDEWVSGHKSACTAVRAILKKYDQDPQE